MRSLLADLAALKKRRGEGARQARREHAERGEECSISKSLPSYITPHAFFFFFGKNQWVNRRERPPWKGAPKNGRRTRRVRRERGHIFWEPASAIFFHIPLEIPGCFGRWILWLALTRAAESVASRMRKTQRAQVQGCRHRHPWSGHTSKADARRT
jgi:hypothetical protein